MYFYINDYTNILQLYILKKNNIDLYITYYYYYFTGGGAI